MPGSRKLPFRARWAVLAAARVYGAIGRRVAVAGTLGLGDAGGRAAPGEARLPAADPRRSRSGRAEPVAHFAFVAPPLRGHYRPLSNLAAELIARGHRATFVHHAGCRAAGRGGRRAASRRSARALPPVASWTGPMARIRGLIGLGGVMDGMVRFTDMFCREAPAAAAPDRRRRADRRPAGGGRRPRRRASRPSLREHRRHRADQSRAGRAAALCRLALRSERERGVRRNLGGWRVVRLADAPGRRLDRAQFARGSAFRPAPPRRLPVAARSRSRRWCPASISRASRFRPASIIPARSARGAPERLRPSARGRPAARLLHARHPPGLARRHSSGRSPRPAPGSTSGC